jgi:hypothetical protein
MLGMAVPKSATAKVSIRIDIAASELIEMFSSVFSHFEDSIAVLAPGLRRAGRAGRHC